MHCGFFGGAEGIAAIRLSTINAAYSLKCSCIFGLLSRDIMFSSFNRYVRVLGNVVHAIQIKTKLCQLVEVMMERRDDLSFCQEMKFRLVINTASVVTLFNFVFVLFEYLGCSFMYFFSSWSLFFFFIHAVIFFAETKWWST